MFKKHSNKEVEKVHLKDDFSEEDYKNDQIQLQVKSSEYVNFSFYKMIKYSEIIQEEINKNDIIKKIEQEIQKIKKTTNIKDENIKTFFQIINEEEVEINNDQYSDLFKLSAVFKIKALKKFLSKYAKSHSKDIDFIIIQIQENTNEVSENNENSSELEKCLTAKINECFTNEKFNKLPISIVYRIIKESSSFKEIDSNLLYDFIKRKKEERYVLFGFLSLHNMNDDKFNDLYQDYLNDQKSKEIKYYEYLKHNLKLIKQLKDDKKSLENQIKNLRINNEQLQIQMSQIKEENQQLKTANQKIKEQMTQSNNENQEFMKK